MFDEGIFLFYWNIKTNQQRIKVKLSLFWISDSRQWASMADNIPRRVMYTSCAIL